ncbi:unnamed protein product [Vitrella brassicaformis CCMP3155]|uniref:Uncharacterized protein n=1 Tax=Vitrella brassicaformis (strain CCMP3155) TaxID=1169540 RepID=A0A0G4EWD4_VITBC|nr:unnamed protein product [Vitrella brassicaformis CCMP3155]|eukprot:CEM02353.1 unnamed protein product [Vitrella brassicaformis CCMP3155]
MSDSEMHQQQPSEPFAVTLSRVGAPAFALSATKELAFGIDDGSLSPAAAARLLTQQKADPNGRYRKGSWLGGRPEPWPSLLHLVAHKCVGEDGAAMLDCLLRAGASVNYATNSYPDNGRPLDILLGRLRCADPRLLSALLPMIDTLLRHGARCENGGYGALRWLFASSAIEEISATEWLEVVTRLTTAAAAAPTPPSLYGYSTLKLACKCRFRQEEEQQQLQEQQQQQQQDGSHDGQTDAHIAILEKLVEGMGREVVEADRGTGALNHAVDSQNRAIMYWLVRQQGVRADGGTLSRAHWDVDVISFLIASYIEPPSLPFSNRTPLGRRLNAALRFFEAQRYALPHIDRGFGNGEPFECSFDGRVVVGGTGGGQCAVKVIHGWEGMGGRGPPGALWGDDESSDDDILDSDDDLDEEDNIDEDGMDEDGLEDGGDGEDLDEGSVAEDGMGGDSGEEEHDGDVIDDDDDDEQQQQQHTEDNQSVDEMDEEHSSSDRLI